jgi:hypothetical protein
VALEELIQDWREVGHGCVGGMGWTGDGDVWEILKVKCWEQGKFVYLWAERVNPIRRVECSRGGGGGGGILDSSLVSCLRLRFRRIFPLILARHFNA